MYDSPKAVHFDAFIDGKMFAPNDPVGLDLRWSVARKCALEGVVCMLRPTDTERRAIERVIRMWNVSWSKHNISVQLNEGVTDRSGWQETSTKHGESQ